MASDKSSTDRIVPNLSRRDLFRTVGLATGGAMLLGLPKFLGGWTSEAEAAGATGLPSSTVHVALELDGIFVSFIDFVEGGNAFADIVPEAVGPDMIQRKRPGPVRFEDIIIEVPLGGNSKPMNNLVTDFLTKNPVARNGVIRFGDISYSEVKRLEFSNALLTEVTLPSLDAGIKDATRLLLRIIPQSTRLLGGTGNKLPSSVPKASGGKVTRGNFRFNVQGLENACGRISKVDSIVARRSVAGAAVGQDRLKQSAPGVLDCSIVRITLPEADAGPFYSWFNDTVVKGTAGGERAGLLEWLDLNGTPVTAVQLGGLGIVHYAPEPVNIIRSESKLKVVQVDMYCESILVTNL